jgi:hypothetical protein
MDVAQKIARCDIEKDPQRRADFSNLPIDVVRNIAMQLAHIGNRSAITASLIHPSFTKEAMMIMEQHGIVLKIKYADDVPRWKNKCKSLRELGCCVPLVHTIRILATDGESMVMAAIDDWRKMMEATDKRHKDFFDTIEVYDRFYRFTDVHNWTAIWPFEYDKGEVKNHTIVSPRYLAGSESCQELTLVEPKFIGNFGQFISYENARKFYVFYLDDGKASTEKSVGVDIVDQLASVYKNSRGVIQKWLEDVLNAPLGAKIYFVAVEPRKTANGYKEASVVHLNQYDGDAIHCLRYYDANWPRNPDE